MAKRIKWSLIGVPDHQGVMNVGGRLGAAHGPHHLFPQLKKMKGPAEIWQSLSQEVMLSGFGADIEENLSLAAAGIRKAHAPNTVSCIIGGGHDHGYSHLLGVKQALQDQNPQRSGLRVGCINIDAHLDVRSAQPVVSSGSPFRISIDRNVILSTDLIEFGIQTHCNAAELWEFVNDKEIEVVPLNELRRGQTADSFKQSLKKLGIHVDAIVVSLDLDAAAECHAPGVSAPQAEGFTSSELVSMMEIAGEDPKVVSLGVFELNPLHDIGDRTARLGATCVYHFVESALCRS